MKYYQLYQYIFPTAFGFVSTVMILLGIAGLAYRKPFIFPARITFVVLVAFLVPLFLISLNHLLVSWPLTPACFALNAFGVTAVPIIISICWWLSTGCSVIGLDRGSVDNGLKSALQATIANDIDNRFCVIAPSWSRYCLIHVRKPQDEAALKSLVPVIRKELNTHQTKFTIRPFLIMLTLGTILAIGSFVSWCSATLCWISFFEGLR